MRPSSTTVAAVEAAYVSTWPRFGARDRMVAPRPLARARVAAVRLRGGGALAELRETGALTATAVPAFTALLGLIVLLVAKRPRAPAARAGLRAEGRCTELVWAVVAGIMLAAAKYMRGMQADASLICAAAFAIGAALVSLTADTSSSGESSSSERGAIQYPQAPLLLALLASAACLSAAAPTMLGLEILHPSSSGSAQVAGLIRRGTNVASPNTAFDGLTCAMRRTVSALAFGGAGAMGVDLIQAHRRNQQVQCSISMGLSNLLTPLIAAMALAPSPAEMFLPLWIASAGVTYSSMPLLLCTTSHAFPAWSHKNLNLDYRLQPPHVCAPSGTCSLRRPICRHADGGHVHFA